MRPADSVLVGANDVEDAEEGRRSFRAVIRDAPIAFGCRIVSPDVAALRGEFAVS